MPEPQRPPPPAAGSPDSEDPFSEENAFSSNGPAAAATNGNDGFADFAAFEQVRFLAGKRGFWREHEVLAGKGDFGGKLGFLAGYQCRGEFADSLLGVFRS